MKYNGKHVPTGVDLNIIMSNNKYMDDALTESVKYNNLENVKYLLKKEKFIKEINTGLLSSIMKGYLEIAEYFLKNGADINYKNSTGNLLENVLKNDVAEPTYIDDILNFLKESGLSTTIDILNETLIKHAKRDNLNIVKFLINNGADKTVLNNNSYLSNYGSKNMISYLLENGVEIEIVSDESSIKDLNNMSVKRVEKTYSQDDIKTKLDEYKSKYTLFLNTNESVSSRNDRINFKKELDKFFNENEDAIFKYLSLVTNGTEEYNLSNVFESRSSDILYGFFYFGIAPGLLPKPEEEGFDTFYFMWIKYDDPNLKKKFSKKI
jgi:ankyrin repeat protein